MTDGGVTKYLSFSFESKLSEKDNDGKVMLQVTSKINRWGANRLSPVARILLDNHVILARNWYFLSCSDISKRVLLRMRLLICNCIWCGKVDYNSAVIRTSKGGIKVFDPLTQTRALLAKMVP